MRLRRGQPLRLRIGESLGIDWETSPFDPERYRIGLEVELEDGQRDPETDVTGDDELLTGKIALAHLREFPDYLKSQSSILRPVRVTSQPPP